MTKNFDDPVKKARYLESFNLISSIQKKNQDNKVVHRHGYQRIKKILDEIKSYNEDDVDSTRQLDDWIRAQAAKLNHDQHVSPMTEVLLGEISVTEHEEPIAVQLLEGVPLDPSERTPEQQDFRI